jgi:RecJ-like exonuclease
MKVEAIPILADAMKEYYDNYELERLCKRFDVEIDYEEMYPDHMKLARKLIDEIEQARHRRLLENLLPELLKRCRERISNNSWENNVYHEHMLPQLRVLQILIGQG